MIDTTAEDPANGEAREPSAKNMLLGPEQAQAFHRLTTKFLYLAARAQQDIRTPIAFLTTRVKEPCTDNWAKLHCVLRYLNRNPGLPLTLRANNLEVIKWWADASFAVYLDMRGHTGGMMTLGKGAMMDMC